MRRAVQENLAEEEICMEGYLDKHVSIHKKGVVTKAWRQRYLTLTGLKPQKSAESFASWVSRFLDWGVHSMHLERASDWDSSIAEKHGALSWRTQTHAPRRAGSRLTIRHKKGGVIREEILLTDTRVVHTQEQDLEEQKRKSFGAAHSSRGSGLGAAADEDADERGQVLGTNDHVAAKLILTDGRLMLTSDADVWCWRLIDSRSRCLILL
jgi:hypothetical protein